MLDRLAQPEYRARYLVFLKLDVPCFVEAHRRPTLSEKIQRRGVWGGNGVGREEGETAVVMM